MVAKLPEHPGRVVARLARQVELAVAAVDLTLPQYRCLILLSGGNEAASALAEKLAVSRPSVTGVVDGLAARGLVKRDHDSDDRRRVGHDLTDAGRQLLAAADFEVERRLSDIAQHNPECSNDPFAGLAPWQRALDAYRVARLADAHAEAASSPNPGPVTTAQ